MRHIIIIFTCLTLGGSRWSRAVRPGHQSRVFALPRADKIGEQRWHWSDGRTPNNGRGRLARGRLGDNRWQPFFNKKSTGLVKKRNKKPIFPKKKFLGPKFLVGPPAPTLHRPSPTSNLPYSPTTLPHPTTIDKKDTLYVGPPRPQEPSRAQTTFQGSPSAQSFLPGTFKPHTSFASLQESAGTQPIQQGTLKAKNDLRGPTLLQFGGVRVNPVGKVISDPDIPYLTKPSKPEANVQGVQIYMFKGEEGLGRYTSQKGGLQKHSSQEGGHRTHSEEKRLARYKFQEEGLKRSEKEGLSEHKSQVPLQEIRWSQAKVLGTPIQSKEEVRKTTPSPRVELVTSRDLRPAPFPTRHTTLGPDQQKEPIIIIAQSNVESNVVKVTTWSPSDSKET